MYRSCSSVPTFRRDSPPKLSSPPPHMAQQWWALDELGDLGELDALLSSATAACDAGVVGDAAPMCARATTSGAPLTPSEAAPDACAQPACGDETSAPGPAVSGDTGGETEAPCYSHQTQDAQPQRSGEGGGHTRRLRCLDERHPPTCARCARARRCGSGGSSSARTCRGAACVLFSAAGGFLTRRPAASQLRGTARRRDAAPVQADGRPAEEERCEQAACGAPPQFVLRPACVGGSPDAHRRPQARRSCAACSPAPLSGRTRPHARSWCVRRAWGAGNAWLGTLGLLGLLAPATRRRRTAAPHRPRPLASAVMRRRAELTRANRHPRRRNWRRQPCQARWRMRLARRSWRARWWNATVPACASRVRALRSAGA